MKFKCDVQIPYSLKKSKKYFILDESQNYCVGSNKIRKLSQTIDQKEGNGLLSYGSCYSNHVLACALLGKRFQVPVKMLILNENQNLNISNYPNLALSRAMGADLEIIDPNVASQKIDEAKDEFKKYLWIPGGCHTQEGVDAYKNLLIKVLFDNKDLKKMKWIIVPFGTGTTCAGVLSAMDELKINIPVYGISVSRNKEKCLNAIKEFCEPKVLKNFFLIDNYSGNYGKIPENYQSLFSKFYHDTSVLVDPIYNIRSVEYIYNNNLKNGLVLVTGGLFNNMINGAL